MKLFCTLCLALVVGFASPTPSLARTSPKAEKGGSKLSLTTGYLYQRVELDSGAIDAHSIRIEVSVDGKGGKGKMVFDPNTTFFDTFGDESGQTEIATRSVEVTLARAEGEDASGKGRVRYEIKGTGLKGRLFLVVGREQAGAHRLVTADKDGKVRRVFSLSKVAQGE